MRLVIGSFDGFHAGHRKLIERAGACGDWGVLTFSGHPGAALSGRPFPLLYPGAERELMGRYVGIKNMFELVFDRFMAGQAPEEFVDFVISRFAPSGFVVGENFRFGRGRSGDTHTLAELCSSRGLSVEVVPSVYLGGSIVSSTRIRGHVSRGQMKEAAHCLGYPYMVRGRVLDGDKRGRTLGYPTANISVPPDKVMPDRGVYAASVLAGGKWYSGAVSVGYNPTFTGQRGLRFEVYMLGFSGDIYGEMVSVFMLQKVRDERRFSGPAELVAQMHRDVEEVRRAAMAADGQYREFRDGMARLL